ncbi:conserved unknown protein [Ectocarpus siliculosus]|uniref:DUF4455 domain-containing protein n=1 Tax=Ectocarpus siliculosus TaxID=2880 RepID=D7FNW1_ECTSI|nr:conserved unknown protein [Ectocarpus siliculosus]|eukprot:CBJ30237.1 conserved unknown protein [Ectocarpus siliculosus]
MSPSLSTAMASARAEQGMLGALGVPRLTVGKNPFIKSQAGLSVVAARPETTDAPYCQGKPTSRGGDSSRESLLASQRSVTDGGRESRSCADRLPALPSPNHRARKDEAHREIDEVRTLHHQPLDPSQPRSGFEKLRKKQAERRERDARAIETFEAGVSAISEDMEQRVLEASYALRDGLEEAEEAVATIRAELGADDQLVQGDMAYVEEIWSKLEAQCNRRSSRIQEFREGLERVEILRSEAVGGELRRLVDDMIAIAFRMPDEIERIAEEHAHELNGVLISNRLAHAELLGTMEKRDFSFAVGIRRVWETRREDWRRLRHDRALVHFHADLTAPNFTNPPERVALFREFKKGQVLRHAERVALLRGLCHRRPVDSSAPGAVADDVSEGRLTTTAVREVREAYAILHGEEIAAILAAQEGLGSIREAKQNESEARREAVRAELHGYGAACTEPDLEACCMQVEAVAHARGLEDFMRKAGGLKHELLALVQGMRSPEIMYDSWLSVAIERTDLVLCGVDLERVLDKQGKAGMRRGLADSVERLRKAPKSDIPSILDAMRRQAADLSQVVDIDPLLAACLDHATEDIDRVVDTIERRGDSDSGGRGGGAASVGSRVSKRSGVGSSRGKGSKSGGSASGSSPGGSRSTGGPRRSTTSRGGGWESEIEIDMLQVRAVQRRLGMLACASDLSEEFKEVLRSTRAALEQKRSCNKAVDLVVSQEADGELTARLSEQSLLMERALRSMDARAQSLHACAERVCSFFAAMALEVETHEEIEAKIDESGEQRMFECKEDFRLADEDREDEVKTSTSRVRMAADENELETSFARVIDLLDQVEESYREYHKTAFTAAAVHPAKAAQEAERVRAAICSLVGLHPPRPPTTETPHNEGGDGEGGIGEGTEEAVTEDEEESNTKHRRASALEEEGAALASDGPEEADSSDTKPVTYRAPGGGGGDASAGAIDYVVDRTPHEVAQDLLSSSVDEEGTEGDETGSATDEENEEHDGPETTPQGGEGQGAETAAAVDAAASGGDGKKGKGKGKGKGEPAMSAADVAAAAVKNLPRYWRGRFVPLEEEDLQALELEKGAEGLEEYFDRRDRRFRELSEEEVEQFRTAADAEAAARAQAKEEAEKAAKKGSKNGGGKGKKPAKRAAAATPPTPEEVAALETAPEPPSVLEAYEEVKREVERHREFRKEEAARRRAEERLVPRDPTGEVVMEELSMPVEEASALLSSLRDDLVSRTETRAAVRVAAAESACLEAQEYLSEELEERLRKHWPRKGRTEVRDKLSEQEKAFREELQRGVSAREVFQKALASMSEGLKDATSVAALQGMESRCKRLVASFEVEHEALQPRLERFIREEPARLLASCDDMTRLCKTFAEGGDYDDQELDELESFLRDPREEVSAAVALRREALVQAGEDHKLGAEDETTFKTEHSRCVMELSLREGLGQRYGAPRRNAQERLRSVIMRDERCAETIHRLLNDLDGLLVSRQVGDTGSFLAGNLDEKAPGWGGSINRPQEEQDRRSDHTVTSSAPAESDDDDRTLTQLLRCKLLSIREALFRHASFLEFLPAPERVDRNRHVPGVDVDVGVGREDGAHHPEQEKEEEEEEREVGGDEIDPEVTLMPQEGETFAGALDSLEGRCRSETRLLYESEGKGELLDETGVPESLRAWLGESRERALGDGGHRSEAKRRLRGQVERFELLVAKRPVPRDVSAGPRAPAVMMLDLSSRLEQQAFVRRRQREAYFERSLSVWAAARTKHQRQLRPAFGSADRREELDELLAIEAARAAEVTEAILSFSRELMKEEVAAMKTHAARVACCFGGVAAILDSVVMVDDLGKLPGDDDLEPKRRGLRRLRKAERTFLKQQQQQEASIADSQPAGGSKKSTAAATAAAADDGDDGGLPSRTDMRGKGRQWERRRWRTIGLSDLTRVILAAGTTTEATAGMASATESFRAVLAGLDAGDSTKVVAGADDEASIAREPTVAGKGTGASSKANGKKGKGGGKGKQAAAAAGAEEVEEDDGVAAAKRRAADREAEVKTWAEGVREALEAETFVTTAHRAAVATRDEIILGLADRAKNNIIEIEERYSQMIDEEAHWGTKWKQLVDLLVKNEA